VWYFASLKLCKHANNTISVLKGLFLNINNAINSLSKTGFLLDEKFINSDKKYSILILNQIKYFLELFNEDEVPLTKGGNLPTKIVKAFVKNADGASKGFYGMRYTEIDSMSVQRVRILAETSKLLLKRKNILSLTKKGRDFLVSSDAQQFIFLFEHYWLKVNFAYFDMYEDRGMAQKFSLNIAHIVFSKNQYLDVPSYIEHFFTYYPQTQPLINDLIEQETFLKSKLEVFNTIINIRVFERFLLLFGLVDSQDNKYKASEFFRSIMMSEPTQEILTTQMISGNLIKETDKMFQELGYRVDLFFEFFFISGVLGAKEEISFASVASSVLERYKVKDQDEEKFLHIHTYYYTLVANFYSFLLDEEREDEHESVIMEKMSSLSSALFHQLPINLLSSALLKNIEQIVIPSLLVIFESYNFDMQTKDFLQQVEEKMGPFVYDKVQHFFMAMAQFSMETKKSKRVTKEMGHDAKLIIMSFIVVCWDVMIRHEEDGI
jgi:hypothetical protein